MGRLRNDYLHETFGCRALTISLLSAKIHIQILQTDLHKLS